MSDTYAMMTTPEKAVYNALKKLGIEFQSQANMLGGRAVRGGAVIDFMIPGLSLLIRVAGEYWHSRPDTKARDELQKIALTTYGWTVVDILASDALRNPIFYVQEALRFISHSRQL